MLFPETKLLLVGELIASLLACALEVLGRIAELLDLELAVAKPAPLVPLEPLTTLLSPYSLPGKM